MAMIHLNNQTSVCVSVCVCENVISTSFRQFISIDHVYKINIFQWNAYQINLFSNIAI